MSEFTLDHSAIARLGKDAARDVGTEMQMRFDTLGKSHRGRPVAEVKAALSLDWERRPGAAPIPDPELTRWAELISAGTHLTTRSD